MSDKSKKIMLDYDVAVKYGTDAAIFLSHLKGWVDYNKRQGVNYREGRTWMYNTVCRKKYNNAIIAEQKVKSLEESLPFWTANQIRYIVEKLVEQKVIITTDKFNQFKNDRKLWYAFYNEEEWFDTSSRLEAAPEYIENGLGNLQLQNQDDLFNPSKQEESGELKTPTGKIPSPTENIPNPKAVSTENIPSPTGKIPNSEIGNFPTHKKDFKNNFNQEEEDNGGGNMETPLEILTTITDMEVIECVRKNYHDVLKFDFNNAELLDKSVKRLFRMFVGMDLEKMNDANIMRIKKELIDTRPALTRSVCWVIILRAFTDYPSWHKDFKNVKSLLGRIEKQKQKYLDDLDREVKKADLAQARSDRNNEAKQQTVSAEKMQTEAADRVVGLIEKHKEFLSAKKINEFRAMIAERKATSAEFQLISLLADKGVEA